MSISIISKGNLIDERDFRDVSKSQVGFVFSYLESVRAVNSGGYGKDKESMLKSVYPNQVYWKIDEFLKQIKDPVEKDKARERILNQFNKFKLRR